MIQGGGVSINKEKVAQIDSLPEIKLLQDKYILVQKGKKR
jgi:tyrosyl-tRNA synthetase